MRVSSKSMSLSLAILGVFCTVFGLYFFEEYSPLSHPINDPNVILWYPIGLALMLGGVASVVAALLETEMANLRRKVEEINKTAGQLTGETERLTEEIGGLEKKVDGFTEKSDKLARDMDELSRTVKTEFEKMSEYLREREGRESRDKN